MKKHYFVILKIIFIYFFTTNLLFAELKNELIQKIQNTKTLSFNFKQHIAEKIETGNCHIQYPRLMQCDYEDSFKKRLISNGKTLAIIQRRYKKIFYYPLKTTPLYLILDKKYLIDFIKASQPLELNKRFIEYEIQEKKRKLSILFDKNSLYLMGWKTIDIYQNEVKFFITDLEINVPLSKNLFKIPSEDNL